MRPILVWPLQIPRAWGNFLGRKNNHVFLQYFDRQRVIFRCLSVCVIQFPSVHDPFSLDSGPSFGGWPLCVSQCKACPSVAR